MYRMYGMPQAHGCAGAVSGIRLSVPGLNCYAIPRHPFSLYFHDFIKKICGLVLIAAFYTRAVTAQRKKKGRAEALPFRPT